jgi:hypothetical protein
MDLAKPLLPREKKDAQAEAKILREEFKGRI